MTVDDIKYKIVKKGICLYAGIKEYYVYICKDNILCGTGDYEDDPEVADDQEIECYIVYYSNILDENEINASAGQYRNYENAVVAAQNSEGFLNWEVLYGQ